MMLRNAALLLALTLLLLSMGCVSPAEPTQKPAPAEAVEDMYSCSDDSDCVCGGVDRRTGKCFLGNKDYHEKYVDKTKTCPDYCHGIDGQLVLRCVDNKCLQMYECLMDVDCEVGSCVNNRCSEIPVKQPVTQPSKPPASETECTKDSDCTTGGCSGQLCSAKSAEPMMTTCEYKEEYACLKDCGCNDGKCGWDKAGDYQDCISKIA